MAFDPEQRKANKRDYLAALGVIARAGDPSGANLTALWHDEADLGTQVKLLGSTEDWTVEEVVRVSEELEREGLIQVSTSTGPKGRGVRLTAAGVSALERL